MHIHNIMILIFITCADHQSHSCRADKNPYRHDGCADKDAYRHDGRAYSLSQILYSTPLYNFSLRTLHFRQRKANKADTILSIFFCAVYLMKVTI